MNRPGIAGSVALRASVFAAAVLASLATSTARAATTNVPYSVVYSFNTPYQVTNLNIFNGDAEGSGTISYGYGDAAADSTTVITSGEQSRGILEDRTFIFGVAEDLPGDPEGQKHLVLFTNDLFAQKAQDIAFGTLFPHTDEDALIAYLQGQPDEGSPTFNFAFGDAESGPNGDLSFHPGDAFTELTFSVGKIGGRGTSLADPVIGETSAAPEPGAWALLLSGVGLLGGFLRLERARRREREVAGVATA